MKQLIKLPLRIQRGFLKLIDSKYVEKKMQKRTGKCKKCGNCCKGCKFLDKKTHLCTTYNHRPFACYKEFPLSNFDKKVWKVPDCGFNFQ